MSESESLRAGAHHLSRPDPEPRDRLVRDARPLGPSIDSFIPPAAPGPALIAGRTVRLERLDVDRHAAGLHAAMRGADWVWDYMASGPFASADDHREWVQSVATLSDPWFYAFVDPSSGRVTGQGSLMRIDRQHGAIEVGHIVLAPAMQRTTAASEAIMRMVLWAFDTGYRRVEWKCDSLNASSRAAALRYGFTFEGVFRQHMIVKGRSRDTAWFSIVDRDWPAIRSRWLSWLDPANFSPDGRQRRALSEF